MARQVTGTLQHLAHPMLGPGWPKPPWRAYLGEVRHSHKEEGDATLQALVWNDNAPASQAGTGQTASAPQEGCSGHTGRRRPAQPLSLTSPAARMCRAMNRAGPGQGPGGKPDPDRVTRITRIRPGHGP